jgi:hypothetical protein
VSSLSWIATMSPSSSFESRIQPNCGPPSSSFCVPTGTNILASHAPSVPAGSPAARSPDKQKGEQAYSIDSRTQAGAGNPTAAHGRRLGRRAAGGGGAAAAACLYDTRT